MKKVSVLIIGIACGLSVSAQNNKVSSSVMHLQDYVSHGDSTELLAAKQSIDDASVNDKTKDEPKTYLYKGEVYVILFKVHLDHLVSTLMISAKGKTNPRQITAEAYSRIDTTTICTAANSFIRVLQINPKDNYADEVRDPANLPTCLAYVQNKAYREYANKRYASALALTQKVLTIFSLLNVSDSSYKEAVELAASAADKAGNTAMALLYYQKMIAIKYGEASPYQALSAMYYKQGDSAKAWDYLEKGRAAYPDDLPLIISETNYYITKHDYQNAENNLTLSISKLEQRTDKDKNKGLLASLYTNLGGIYDHKANPRDDKGNDLPKPADYEVLFSKADSNYTKALNVTPDNFDLLYNLGALYFNRAVPVTKEANNLPLNAKAKYDKLMDQAKVYFLKAQPYFEKAYKINPKDASNTNALMQVYVNTNQNDKAEALKK